MRVAAALWAAAWILGGCAAWQPPQTRELLAAPLGLPARIEHVDVPFHPQTPLHCGPAALATVLGSIGLPVDPDRLAGELFLPAREGSLQTEMLAAARRWGAPAYRLPGELRSVLAEVAAGHPVLVLQNLGLDFVPRWHYAVVVGYDLEQPQVVLRSGVTRREVLTLATFEHTWARSAHWAMVVLPPGQLPATVDETGAVQAALGFERVATPTQAARVYESVLTRWPGNLVAGMGLGNTRFAAGDWAAAATAYDAVARRHGHAAAWNNLAQTEWRRGDLDAALDAAEHAVELAQGAQARWFDVARATRDQVRTARRQTQGEPAQ